MLLFLFLFIKKVFFWNFHFRRNLNDRETFELLVLMNLLNSLNFSPLPNRGAWSLDSSGSYICKFLVKNPSSQW